MQMPILHLLLCTALAPFLVLELQQPLIIPFDLLPEEGVFLARPFRAGHQTAHLVQLQVQPPLPYLPR
jgi:hypothetical protein